MTEWSCFIDSHSGEGKINLIFGVPAAGAAGQEPALREQSWGSVDAARPAQVDSGQARHGGWSGQDRAGLGRRRLQGMQVAPGLQALAPGGGQGNVVSGGDTRGLRIRE